MSVPDWRTSTASSRVRGALWLHSEVGEGGTFTKTALRDAFPDVAQIDRRVRDLRDVGWVITEYRVDRALGSSGEMRLVKEGDAVWADGYRWPSDKVSNKQRQEIYAADNYLCVLCGIAGGEAYPDDALVTAKLTLARQPAPGREAPMLRTTCDRCRAGAAEGGTADEALADIERLDEPQRARVRRWVTKGLREPLPEDRAWARYRRLPAEARREVEAQLRQG